VASWSTAAARNVSAAPRVTVRSSATRIGAQRGPRVLGTPLDPEPGAQPLDDLLGRRDAEVGGEQDVLDGLPGVLVEPVPAEQAEQPAAEAALGAGQPLPQPDHA
jgi:hypothetical protein